MIIVRLLSPEPVGWLTHHQLYSGLGADIVMESISLRTVVPVCSWWKGDVFVPTSEYRTFYAACLSRPNVRGIVLTAMVRMFWIYSAVAAFNSGSRRSISASS